MKGYYFIIAVLVGVSSLSGAQVIRIPGDQPTIQSGIDRARDGDTVLIAEGIYYENINYHGKAITVASHYLVDGDPSHISRTIINGSRALDPDTASVVTMRSGEDTTSILCGLTITAGGGTLVDHIHTLKGYTEVIHRAGGGVFIYNSGGKIIHNIIEGNHLVAADTLRGTLGCGLLAAVNHNHTAIIRNNIIRNNTGTGRRGWGGGVSLHGGRVLCEWNSILNNTVTGTGMAMAAGLLYENESQEGTIEEAVIRNNIVSGNRGLSKNNMAYGGGIYMTMGFEQERIRIYNNIISNNCVEGWGGGMSAFETHAEIFNNIIANNRATIHSSSLALDGRNNDIIMSNNLVWSGDMWIASSLCIAPLHPGSVHIRSFSAGEGILNEVFSEYFSVNPLTGKISIGKKEGLIPFRPDSIQPGTFEPPAVIIEFRRFSHASLDSAQGTSGIEISGAHRLDLSHKDNLIQFKFASLDHSGPEGSKFSYYMEGVDPDTIIEWSQTARYTNMDPGKYRFWATGQDHEGAWYPEGITLDIHIPPPWYRSAAATSGYIIFVILVVLGYVRMRTRQLKKEKINLENLVTERTAELRQKSEQIIEMERLKTRFFTDVSHEIRTPLSLISGPLDNLIKKEHKDQQSVRWLHMIRRNSNRLLQLVNQLLDISRLDSGRMKLVLEKSNVNRHLRLLVSEFYSLAESRSVRFVIDIPESELIAWYDREKVEKVVSNLLSNAFKFTPERGTVTCRVKVPEGIQGSPEGNLRIIVADTGHGIPETERQKIFERFYRSESELYEDAGGTGIGLSVTREMIRLMHGEVAVKSLAGKGAVFIVTIPIGKDHLKEEEYMLKEPAKREQLEDTLKREPGRTEKAEEIPKRGTEILIVEDNEDLRTFIGENLSGHYTILEAEDGVEGLKQAQSRIPDLVISDVMIPGMDGMELCRELKNDERTSHIPVIMLTARTSGRDKIEGLEKGADDYIFKPFDIDELTVRIRNLLEQRARLRKKYSGMIGLDWNEMAVTTLDERFLKKATGVIAENMQDFDFDVGALQEKVSMSREHLYRKMKALTGESPSSLIRLMRLKTAASLLEKGEEDITRIAYHTGFSSLSYFARRFKEHYGTSPREYRKVFKK